MPVTKVDEILVINYHIMFWMELYRNKDQSMKGVLSLFHYWAEAVTLFHPNLFIS